MTQNGQSPFATHTNRDKTQFAEMVFSHVYGKLLPTSLVLQGLNTLVWIEHHVWHFVFYTPSVHEHPSLPH